MKITWRHNVNSERYADRPVFRLKSVKPGFRGICCLLLVLFSIVVISGSAYADEADSNAINWAYQSSLGSGLFIDMPDNSKIYKLPISYTFDDLNDKGWALKLKLPITVGIYGVETANQNIDLDVLSVAPGIELQIPVADNWTLMPLANFGLGKDTSGGGSRYLYSLGVKHQLIFAREAVDFTFGNTLRYDGYSAEGDGGSGYLPSFSTGVEIRFPLGFNLFRKPGLLSLYGVYLHYFDGVTVIYAEEKNFEVDNQQELGLTLSTIPSWKIWGIPIERVGIGYRFSGRFSSIRLVFGMPF